MRLNQIRDFIAVVQAGSLRAAARAVGVSQPAITKSIRQLEEELHVQLLIRSGRGAIATRAGKAFLARAKVVQSELGKIDEDLAQERGERGGSVVIGVSPATSVLLVPDGLAQFRRRYPEANVRLVEGMTEFLLPMVRDATLDFAVGPKSLEKLDKAIRFKPLFTVPMVIAARRGHPLRAAKSLRELAGASWVTFRGPGQRSRMLERLFSPVGLPHPRIMVQCESYTTALAVLGSTDALALFVPQMLAERYAHGLLEQIRVEDPVPNLVFGMFVRTDAPLAPAASAMAVAVTATARSLARVLR